MGYPAIDDVLARKVLSTVDAGLVYGLGEPEPGKMCVEAAVCYALGLPHSDNPACVAPALRSLKIGLNDSAWSSPEARAKGMRRLALAQLGTAGVLDENDFLRRVVEKTIRVTVPRALYALAKLTPRYAESLKVAAKRCEIEGTRAAARAAADAAARVAARAADVAADAAADAAARVAARVAADAAYVAARAAADVAADAAAYVAARAAADAAARAVARAAADAAYVAARAAYAASDQELSGFAEMVVQILIEMKAPGCQWLYLTEARLSGCRSPAPACRLC